MLLDINSIFSGIAVLCSIAALYFSQQEKKEDNKELLIKLSSDVQYIKNSLINPVKFGVLENTVETHDTELGTVRDRIHTITHDLIRINAKDIK